MCKPSEAMKNLNTTVQNFSNQVTSEAGTVFGASNSVFNNIMSATQGIVAGGPSQAGYSQEELSADTAANENAGGAMARNLKGATSSAVSAIGGGNTVAPSGSTQAAVENAETSAAAQTAAGQNQIVQNDYAAGRQNFFNALGAEESAPGVYAPANAFNQTASQEQTAAMTSQQNIDTQNNWWKSALLKVATTTPSDMMKNMPGMGGGSTSSMPSPPSGGQNQGMSSGGGGTQWGSDSFAGSGDSGGGDFGGDSGGDSGGDGGW